MSITRPTSLADRQVAAICAAFEAFDAVRDHRVCDACAATFDDRSGVLDHVDGCARNVFIDAADLDVVDASLVAAAWLNYCMAANQNPVIGEFPHSCAAPGCDHVIPFDDEPWCFTHSPDSGSSQRGFSALLWLASTVYVHSDDDDNPPF